MNGLVFRNRQLVVAPNFNFGGDRILVVKGLPENDWDTRTLRAKMEELDLVGWHTCFLTKVYKQDQTTNGVLVFKSSTEALAAKLKIGATFSKEVVG
eukprot:CAMPEP_0174254310 /NCGR_PEP_ID=MMETSP0439-20130205/3650_1 /TAXON_ID=0 /ORGANISM="Stereomyxa ramosa, Strain Chinc5" /LENGTH=96 /DNA_ID=CAMNT_0015335825 /DNA_START=359 /DNA_END=645 /DNA_ORIENTATION=-